MLSGVAGIAALLLAATGCSKPTGGPGAAVAEPKADSKTAGPPTAMNAPDQIGSLTKAADQTKAQETLTKLHTEGGYKQAVAKFYEDRADKKHTVMVTGFIGSPNAGKAPTEADLGGLLKERVAPGSSAKPIVVDHGAAGGTAMCIDSAVETIKSYECAWINGFAVMFVAFKNFEPTKAAGLMPQILTSVVKS